MYDAESDPQQYQVYDAEDLLFKGLEFTSIKSLREYISEVIDTRWMRNRGWAFRVWSVRNSHGTWAWCNVDNDVCTLIFPRGTRNQLMVMHELAHALTVDGHGPEFCAMYIRCVRKFMGPEYAEVIRRGFAKPRVKHRQRKSPWATPLDSIECDFFS
jgi:putative metallohydrolase (TIGR04338 family)